MGADQEPRWRTSMESEERACDRPRRARSFQEASADNADDRSLSSLRPGLRENFTALLRASRSVRRRIRPRLVQINAPRHGSGDALSRPAGAQRTVDLARSNSGRESSADRRAVDCFFEAENPPLLTFRIAARFGCVGFRFYVPRFR